jgi:DNA-binding response OmpR family regulator
MEKSAPEFRALVADPSTHMAGLITLMLHSLKIRAVDEADSVARAETFLARRRYDIVLIDEQLAGAAGFAAIRHIRGTEDHPNRLSPIIMTASAPSAAMIAMARDAGVTEFLRKPFSAQHIALRLEAIRKAPRAFIAADGYAGPDRRRQEQPGKPRRRSADEKRSA